MKIIFIMIDVSLLVKSKQGYLNSWSQNNPSIYGVFKSYSQPILYEDWLYELTNPQFSGNFPNGPFRKLLMLLSVHLTLSHPMLSLGRICFWRNIEYWNIVTYHIRCYLWGESVIGSTEYWILRYCNISHQMLSKRRIRSWLDGYLSWTRGRPRRALWKMAEEIYVSDEIISIN